ncbi:MAG: ATP synthase subunit I [Planctomycetota bacterium]
MVGLQLLIGLVAGAAGGAAFFATLWYTTRALPTAEHPALLAMGSLVGRMAMMVGVFLLIARHGRWEPLAAALLGFVLVRVLAVRHVRGATGAS